MLSAIFAVAAGGSLGAAARFATVKLTQFLLGSRFPLGTLLVNCVGSFLIGFFMYLLMERSADNTEYWRLFIVVGFLGSYTTFSSFAWETWTLYADGQWLSALTNILLNNLATLTIVLLGIKAGRLMGGNV